MPDTKFLTIGDISQITDHSISQVKHAVGRDRIEPRQRAGIIRLWSTDDLPAIRAALRRSAEARNCPLPAAAAV